MIVAPLASLAACFPPFDAPPPDIAPSTLDTAAGLRVPADLEQAAAITLTGGAAHAWSGDALAVTGALAGGPHLAVGAKGANAGSGMVHLVPDAREGAEVRSLADAPVRWRTDQACAALGADLAALSSASGEHEALAIGAPRAYGDCGTSEGTGAVWIVTGEPAASPSPTTIEDAATIDPRIVQVVGTATDQHAGIAVDAAGDLDGDGRGDLVVGSLPSDPEALGTAWLLLAPFHRASASDPAFRSLAEADLVLSGERFGDRTGCAVAGIGDFAGTGDRWVAVGASLALGVGEVRLFEILGAPGQGIEAGEVRGRVGAARGDRYGVGVHRGGDLDGDGTDDAVVLAHSCGYDFAIDSPDCRDGRGRVGWHVLSGALSHTGSGLTEAMSLSVPDLHTHFSCDGAAAGPFLGDPDAVDLAIGGCTDTLDRGEVYLFPDAPAARSGAFVLPDDAAAIVTVPGTERGALAGGEIAAAADTLLVGAWKASPDELDEAGMVFVIPAEAFSPLR